MFLIPLLIGFGLNSASAFTAFYTNLWGSLSDQAALYGLLSRLRDLGLTLLSVQCVDQESDG